MMLGEIFTSSWPRSSRQAGAVRNVCGGGSHTCFAILAPCNCQIGFGGEDNSLVVSIVPKCFFEVVN